MIVEKIWGHEKIIANTNKYCGKILVLQKGFQSSIHRHLKKDETFYILNGKVKLIQDKLSVILLPGDSVRIKPKTWHCFAGIQNSEILEISTHHDDEDVERKDKSGRIPDVKTYAFDIDDTLCFTPNGTDYLNATPNFDMITIINRLYDNGCYIKIETSRGQRRVDSDTDWTELTRKQLELWQVKYNEFYYRPHADVRVDDKSVTPTIFLGLMKNEQ